MSLKIPVIQSDKFTELSRHGDLRHIKSISSDELIITAKCHFARAGFRKGETNPENPEKGLAFIDFDGGPFIAVGNVLESEKYSYEIVEIHKDDYEVKDNDKDIAQYKLKVNRSKRGN